MHYSFKDDWRSSDASRGLYFNLVFRSVDDMYGHSRGHAIELSLQRHGGRMTETAIMHEKSSMNQQNENHDYITHDHTPGSTVAAPFLFVEEALY